MTYYRRPVFALQQPDKLEFSVTLTIFVYHFLFNLII